jgi:pyruvate dehydrogenase complex dehydrogenase (E1) component
MPSVVIATLAALAKDGTIEPALVKDAMGRYGVDGDAADPYTL